MTKYVKTVAITAVVVVVLVTIFQNTETVETRILFMTVSMPLFLLLLTALLLGFGIGFLAGWGRRRKTDDG